MTPRTYSAHEKALREAWWRMVLTPRKCAVCTSRKRLQAHHLIEQQVIRRVCRTLGLDHEVWLWDRRIGMCVCTPCHTAHTDAVKRIPSAKISPLAWEYAEELDALHGPGMQPMTMLLEARYA